MGKLTIPLIVIIVAIVIVVPQTLFVVDETQLAIVTRFGEFKRSHTSPGLQVKTPFAEQVTKFDKRLLRVDVAPASLLTEDKRNLLIDSYARYRIIDPLIFFKNLRNEAGADSRVADIVNAQLRQELARDLQEEIIKETREDIMRRVTEASNRAPFSRADVLEDFGSLTDPAVIVTVIDESLEDVDRIRLATAAELAALQSDAAPAILEGLVVEYAVDIRQALGIEIVDVRIKRADFPTDIELKKEILLRAISAEGPAEDLAEAERALARLEWMEEHGSEIDGLDPELPLLPQFDLLTDEQIRAAFRSMDPLVN